MLRFNVDLDVRFYFEFENTQRTLVECKSCEKKFTLIASLKWHVIEIHGRQLTNNSKYTASALHQIQCREQITHERDYVLPKHVF